MDVLIEKAPYLGSVLFVVLIFIRAWSKDADRREKFDLARMKELERIGSNCHEHTKQLNERTNKAIDNASRIIENNTKIIGAIEKRMNGVR